MAKTASLKNKGRHNSHRHLPNAHSRSSTMRSGGHIVAALDARAISTPPMPIPGFHAAITASVSHGAIQRIRAEQVRKEFSLLAEEWRKDTQHLSQISKKVTHPAYFRIMGMGDRVVPLLLEALRDRPAHWFSALKAITNVDPVPIGANPAMARESWLAWGRNEGLLD
jgi:hypothetical protein